MKIVGIVLIVLGVLALAYQGIQYTTREKIVEIGSFKVTADKHRTIPLPPIVIDTGFHRDPFKTRLNGSGKGPPRGGGPFNHSK